MLRRTLLIGLAISGWAGQALAGPPEEHGLCWRGRPLPECRSFILTDFGLQARLDDDPTGGSDTPLHVSLDVGYARNTSPHSALGATAYAATGTDHARLGVRARYRRWLSRDFSIDVAPGLLLYGSEDNGYDYQAPGQIVSVSLSWKDWIGMTVEAEHSQYKRAYDVPNSPSELSDTTWRVGGKLGSAAGVLGTAAVLGFWVYLLTTIEE